MYFYDAWKTKNWPTYSIWQYEDLYASVHSRHWDFYFVLLQWNWWPYLALNFPDFNSVDSESVRFKKQHVWVRKYSWNIYIVRFSSPLVKGWKPATHDISKWHMLTNITLVSWFYYYEYIYIIVYSLPTAKAGIFSMVIAGVYVYVWRFEIL